MPPDRVVLVAANATTSCAVAERLSRALPPLKPYHPNHKIKVPSICEQIMTGPIRLTAIALPDHQLIQLTYLQSYRMPLELSRGVKSSASLIVKSTTTGAQNHCRKQGSCTSSQMDDS